MAVCSAADCDQKVRAKGLCRRHYDRAKYQPVVHHCPTCGPFSSNGGSAAVCPTCDLTPDEHAYIDRILADSDAVYRLEHREFQAKRCEWPERDCICPTEPA
jgi:hypothetical protein